MHSVDYFPITSGLPFSSYTTRYNRKPMHTMFIIQGRDPVPDNYSVSMVR